MLAVSKCVIHHLAQRGLNQVLPAGVHLPGLACGCLLLSLSRQRSDLSPRPHPDASTSVARKDTEVQRNRPSTSPAFGSQQPLALPEVM